MKMPVDNPKLETPEQILQKYAEFIEEPVEATVYRKGIWWDTPTALAALDAYYKAQASKDMAEVIGEDEPEDYYNQPDSLAISRNVFREEQRKTAAEKGYKLEGE